jgi:hypothetical protein
MFQFRWFWNEFDGIGIVQFWLYWNGFDGVWML